MAMDDPDLSGTWKGVFSYPHSLPPNPFDAELRDHAGMLTGETCEVGGSGRSKGQPLHAMIEGHRHGFAISLVKRYDALRRANTPVYYSGTVNADGTEISGVWDIPGSWSGTFLMIRAKPKTAAVERKIAEEVR